MWLPSFRLLSPDRSSAESHDESPSSLANFLGGAGELGHGELHVLQAAHGRRCRG